MPTRRKKSAPQVGRIQPAIKARALKVLNDPKVQEWILENADVIVDAAKQWADFFRKKVWRRFGQKGLERRAANVRAAVAALSRESPDLAVALRPVTKSLDEVDQLLKVSAVLPFAKRKKAHMKIDDILDNLESGLFDATLRGARPNSQT
jgi:hypothetical protein